MINVEELLKPVSADVPTGEDLSYDPELAGLQLLIKGKPETQFSAAEEPDWRAIREKALDLFKRTKDLRVAVTLCLAELKLDGLTGFAQGLEVIRGMVERSWAGLFPKLDPEEGNDPTERLNVLGAIAAPAGTFGDPFAFIDNLRRIPLAESARLGRYSLADIKKGEAEGSPQEGQISAAFQDTDAEILKTKYVAVQNAHEHVTALDHSLGAAVGAGQGFNISPLTEVLAQIKKALADHLPVGTVPAETAATPTETAAIAVARNDGEIRSRQDVIRALQGICDYYAKHEPSSPLPFLLQRAQRLVEMNFLEAISELTPEAVAQLQNIMGIKPSPPASS
jgi:type VI secretion system protein ImpA